jgi:hypothetical protein
MTSPFERKKVDLPQEPLRLFVERPDGTMAQQQHFVCAHCSTITSCREYALDCCRQYYCKECKNPTGKHFPTCHECRKVKTLHSAAVIDLATYSGPLYADRHTRYFEDLDAYLDWAACADKDDLPEYLYCCTVRKFSEEDARGLVETMLECALEDYHEEAFDQIEDEVSLVSFFQSWLGSQSLESYLADMTRKVLAPLPEPDKP